MLTRAGIAAGAIIALVLGVTSPSIADGYGTGVTLGPHKVKVNVTISKHPARNSAGRIPHSKGISKHPQPPTCAAFPGSSKIAFGRMSVVVCGGEPGIPARTPAGAPPQVTPAMALQAFRSIGVPSARTVIQPAGKTLVNFDTIFYTQTRPFTRTVTLLGQQVRLEIAPTRYTWKHGDGTTTITTTPGAPYPRKDITHRYQDAAVTVHASVAVTWGARWSLNGGPLQPVLGTITTNGPTTPLRIAEAVPALSGAGH